MKYLPSVLAALIAAVAAVAAPLQSEISHHPEVAAVLGAAYAILAHLLPSPIAESK